MKSLSVGEAKSHFSELLSIVLKGEKVKILYGRGKRPVAMLVPISEDKSNRSIGVLEGKAFFVQEGNGKISEDEFLGI